MATQAMEFRELKRKAWLDAMRSRLPLGGWQHENIGGTMRRVAGAQNTYLKTSKSAVLVRGLLDDSKELHSRGRPLVSTLIR